MLITTGCPFCGCYQEVADEKIGQRVGCIECGGEFEVPSGLLVPPPPSLLQPATPVSERPFSDAATVSITCAGCTFFFVLLFMVLPYPLLIKVAWVGGALSGLFGLLIGIFGLVESGANGKFRGYRLALAGTVMSAFGLVILVLIALGVNEAEDTDKELTHGRWSRYRFSSHGVTPEFNGAQPIDLNGWYAG